MPVSAHDVAREIRSQLPTSGRAKIHKLLYLCQGWYMAWYGQPLFVEDIEAWDNGPVVADLWRDEQHGGGVPTAEQLAGGQLLVLDFVVGRYGMLTGRELIELTHSEGPWAAAFSRGWQAKVITLDELREFFTAAEREDVADEEYPADDAAVAEMLRRAPAVGPHDTVRDETDDIRRWLADVIG